MKRISKILMFIGLLTITAFAVVWFRLDAIAKSSLEESLTNALGVSTEISSLSINKLTGQAHIDDLLIDNPQNYSAEHIFNVKDLDVDFVPLSLLSPTIEISSLKLDDITVNFEQTLRENNILDIVNHVKNPKKQRAQSRIVAAQFSFKGKRFEIESVKLANILVNVNLSPLGNLIPFGGLSQEVKVQVPDIDLQNVTSENAQLVLAGTLDEVVSGLLGNLAGGIFDEVPKQMESDDVQGILGDLLDQLPR